MINNESPAENGLNPERAEQLAQLAAVPETLRRLVGDRSAEDLRQPGQDGGSAVVEVLCHLLDWEEITGDRVWRMLHTDTPEFESFDDSLWSIENDYVARNGIEALDAFVLSRSKLVETLAGLDNAAWQRGAILGTHGTITLAWLIEKIAAHDEKHIVELNEALS